MNRSLDVEITADGYLRLEAAVARRHFPDDLLVVLARETELWLLPTRGAAAGGLVLKQRNTAGDRSVLVSEVLGFRSSPGVRQAFWDSDAGALRVDLRGRS